MRLYRIFGGVICSIIIFCSLLLASTGKIDELLSKETGISAEEATEIKRIYSASENENLFPEIILNLFSEGFSKRAQNRHIIAAAERKMEQLRQIKLFCQESESKKFKIPYTYRNAEIFLFALGNNVSFDDIMNAYELAEANGYFMQDYLELVKRQSALARRNVPGVYSRRLLKLASERKMPFKYLKKLMKIVEDNSHEESREAVIQAMNENMNLYEIENAIISRRGHSAQGLGKAQPNKSEIGESIRREKNVEEKSSTMDTIGKGKGR